MFLVCTEVTNTGDGTERISKVIETTPLPRFSPISEILGGTKWTSRVLAMYYQRGWW